MSEIDPEIVEQIPPVEQTMPASEPPHIDDDVAAELAAAEKEVFGDRLDN